MNRILKQVRDILKSDNSNEAASFKASKSKDLEALKLAASGIITSNQIMQDWVDLEGV